MTIFKNYLIGNGVESLEVANIEENVEREMQEAVAYVKTCPPPPIEEVEKYVYAESS